MWRNSTTVIGRRSGPYVAVLTDWQATAVVVSPRQAWANLNRIRLVSPDASRWRVACQGRNSVKVGIVTAQARQPVFQRNRDDQSVIAE